MLIIQALGNLGQDPEEKTSSSGVKFCRFSLATNKKVKGEKVTTWLNVTVFDERKIEFLTKYVTKGTKLFIEGEPQVRAYEKDGEARASFDIILGFGSKIEICSSDNGAASDAAPAQSKPAPKQANPSHWDWDDDLNDDIPWN
jgi:single-strand DNA-binding protein